MRQNGADPAVPGGMGSTGPAIRNGDVFTLGSRPGRPNCADADGAPVDLDAT
jgi:hypothetical protein